MPRARGLPHCLYAVECREQVFSEIRLPRNSSRVLCQPSTWYTGASPLVGVLLFRTGIRGVVDWGLFQHFAALVQGALDNVPGLVDRPSPQASAQSDR